MLKKIFILILVVIIILVVIKFLQSPKEKNSADEIEAELNALEASLNNDLDEIQNFNLDEGALNFEVE